MTEYLKQSASFRSFDETDRKLTAKRNFSKFRYDWQLGSDFCIGSQLGSHQLPHVCKQSDATEQLTSSKENKGRRGREMGRPKLENALTNAEKKTMEREKQRKQGWNWKRKG